MEAEKKVDAWGRGLEEAVAVAAQQRRKNSLPQTTDELQHSTFNLHSRETSDDDT
jgi:hypothetical protein